ncbi:MAG: very short patch repair endonuclease [Pseudomonadota bacterium]|jgi:DNA mismatch endonuclease (patch repair protein)
MVDRVSKEKRSEIMRAVGSKNTTPELIVRKMLFSMGYRFRLHRKDLPGTPDIVFPGRRAVIFVHGCFWHGHRCRKGKLPCSRIDFWAEKIRRNKERDAKVAAALRRIGWAVLRIWQCQLTDPTRVEAKIRNFLGRSQ